MSVAIDRQVG